MPKYFTLSKALIVSKYYLKEDTDKTRYAVIIRPSNGLWVIQIREYNRREPVDTFRIVKKIVKNEICVFKEYISEKMIYKIIKYLGPGTVLV